MNGSEIFPATDYEIKVRDACPFVAFTGKSLNLLILSYIRESFSASASAWDYVVYGSMHSLRLIAIVKSHRGFA
jgi:hypothetical protein